MGSKRGGGSIFEVSQTLRHTEAVEIICIQLFYRWTQLHRKLGKWRRLGMNLGREMEEGVGGVEGGEKKLVTREMGNKTLGLEQRGKDLFCVTLYANILKITSSVI